MPQTIPLPQFIRFPQYVPSPRYIPLPLVDNDLLKTSTPSQASCSYIPTPLTRTTRGLHFSSESQEEEDLCPLMLPTMDFSIISTESIAGGNMPDAVIPFLRQRGMFSPEANSTPSPVHIPVSPSSVKILHSPSPVYIRDPPSFLHFFSRSPTPSEVPASPYSY